MSEIGIITHYGVHNHGAQLQLFALLTLLRNKGHCAHALQFEKDYRYMEKSAANKYRISIKSVPFYVGYLFKKGLRKTFFNMQKKRIFDQFRTEYDVLGGKAENFSGDLAIVGSDEVFSFETGVTGTFWGEALNARRLASYAASFGPTTLQEIKEKDLEAFVAKGLSRFDFLSVRDSNSADIVSAFSDKRVSKNCDPVILYGYTGEIASYADKVKPAKPFILLYSYDNNMNSAEDVALVRTVAGRLSLPVYSVGFYHKWCDKNINASPLELLGWFKNSAYIVTDTFHGTVLSLITHSRFATKVRGNGNKICNLLGEYGLENRIFTDTDSCMKLLSTGIDYDAVENQMSAYRKDAERYLDSVLDSAEKSNG